jgi:hypothetical protein
MQHLRIARLWIWAVQPSENPNGIASLCIFCSRWLHSSWPTWPTAWWPCPRIDDQPACDALLESLITRGYAVISGPKWFEDERSLRDFWASPISDRTALQPLQGVEGYRELADGRQMLEHRAGPWLEESPLLGTLLQVLQRAGW